MSILNQRRHKRYDINLAASLIEINNSNFIHCMIRDFCAGGLFLVPQQGSNATGLKVTQQIQVVFSVNTIQGKKEFRQDAKIMNIHAEGIGIAFEKDSAATFSALQNEAQNKLGSLPTDRANLSPKQKIQDKIESDLVNLMEETLPKIIHDFFQRTNTKLSEEINTVKNIEKSNILQNTLTVLSQNKAELIENFCKNVHEICHLTSSAPLQQEQQESENTLSLVDKNDFEDWLDLSFYIRNLDLHFKRQLEKIEQKLAILTGLEKNKINNPTSPAVLCNNFRDAISTIEENQQAKHSLYNGFEESLLHLLPDVYRNLDNLLVNQGAPEQIVDSPTNWLNINPGSGSAINTPNFTRNEQVIDSPSFPVNNFGGVSAGPAIANVTAPVATDQTTKSLADVATNLLHLIKQQSPGQVQQHQSASNSFSSNYSIQEISHALGKIQQNTIKNNSFDNESTQIQPELLNTLKSSAGPNKQISDNDLNNLQVYENLFEILFNELLTGEEVKSHLQRIRVPIMNLAMQDPSFMDSDTHPARNIVNHLSFLEPAIAQNKMVKNEQINKKIDHLMTQISDESLNNTEIFDSVEKQLLEITNIVNKSVDKNIKRIVEVYDGKEKLESARTFIQDEINQRIAGKKVPKIILTLLEAGWQHLLVFAKVNNDNNGLQSYLRVITNLNSWLLGGIVANNEQINNTLEFIDKNLQTVCTNTFLHNNILTQLSELLSNQQVLTDESSELELTSIPTPTKEKVSKEKVSTQIEELEQLKVGDWLTFVLEKKPEPLELIWIGDHQNLYVFVNRSGIKKFELKAEELAEKIKNGTAKRSENLDLPVMDRATNTMLQKMHEQLISNAIHDPVTNLLNRKEYVKQMKQELLFFDDIQHLLCNIEIQDFRLITSACGSKGGDALLKQLAELLRSLVGKDDIIARLDNITFSVLLKNHAKENALTELKKLQSEIIKTAFDWKDKSYAIAVAIGIFPLTPESDHELDSILQKTDIATLAATTAGRNHIQIYEDKGEQALQSQYDLNEWAGRINQVFKENRLFLRCQKISRIDPDKSVVSHYEILLGIYDENGKVIPPDIFIPAVEHCQRMHEIDRWVVLSVFEWIEQNEFDFEIMDGFSINLSGESLNSDEFLEFLTETLSNTHISLEKITFEVTETVAASNVEFVKKFIKQIKQFNCKFSLDDFGSGYSSYSYLKSLDVDYLKIDGAFVKDMVDNPADIAIVTSMNDIAHALGLETVAEFVENEQILEKLNEIGVDFAQGWGIEKPKLLSDLV